jgi:hypothetical protein
VVPAERTTDRRWGGVVSFSDYHGYRWRYNTDIGPGEISLVGISTYPGSPDNHWKID